MFCTFYRVSIYSSQNTARDITTVMEQYQTWNATLEQELQQWAGTHSDVTAFLFSSWVTFSRVFDDPSAFGFHPDDISQAGGGIWMDRMRPTSAMHRVIADDLVLFLDAHSPHDQQEFSHNRACISASNAV